MKRRLAVWFGRTLLTLTRRGMHYAERLLRKHATSEEFLVTFLEFLAAEGHEISVVQPTPTTKSRAAKPVSFQN